MIIRVTTKDMTNGDKMTDACPLTMALRRHFGDNVSVSRDFIRILNKDRAARNKWILIPLPKPAQNYMLNYNVYVTVKGFKFELPPEHVKILKDNI